MVASNKYAQKKTADLIPYVNNSRTHDEKQVSQIAASIKEFGFTNPILIDEENSIIAGHGRLMAANKLKLSKVPTITLSGLTDAQKRAYVIADNRLALNAGWDDELLKNELQILNENDFDLDVLGFEEDELAAILADDDPVDGLTDEDDVPEVPEVPVTVLGDIWLLGDHRLMCGDSTDQGSVALLMNGVLADMVFTDPPYNTGMTAQTQSGSGGLWKGNNKKDGGKPRLSHMFNDAYTDEEWFEFLQGFCKSYDVFTKKDCFLFICLDWRRSHELVPHIKERWKFSNLIIWDKIVHGLGSDYKYTHEFIHVCKKGKPKAATNREGDREYQDVWRIQRKIGKDEDHATKKPIELCERGIRHGSKYKDKVLDLFGGSGSTLIASEKNNRYCYMMELDPKYCDVIIKRWQGFTGKEAILEATSESYQGVKDARG